MIKELRFFRLPSLQTDVPEIGWYFRDLYLTEIGEIEVEQETIWECREPADHHFLVFCTRGSGIVLLSGEQLPLTADQYFIVPKNQCFKFYNGSNIHARFLIAGFNGTTADQLSREYSVVRNLTPSVNNMVANREMLFDEIFNNLAKGFHDQKITFVNFCFGHLLAAFIFANQTSEDLADESNPAVRKAIQYFKKNLDKKLTLRQVAQEAGYATTYFTILFKKVTNYPPLSYFSHLKILKACEYLDYTSLKIKDISYRLGYSDPYYFTRDFRKKMGLSPRQYRNRIRI